MAVPPDIAEIVQTVCEQLVASGAQAVILTGSRARGTAGRRSDIDLYAVGDGPTYRLEAHAGQLVSVSWRTEAEVHREFLSPDSAGAAVPGWRSAVTVHDPDGMAATLITKAQRWSWDDIGDERINSWVAEEITGYAEEALKLVSMLDQGQLRAAAVQRSILALRMAVLLSVHLRLLYDSENVLWDLVGKQMGPDWQSAQNEAFGLAGVSFEDSCRASLALFNQTVERVRHLLNERQLAVVSLVRR